MSLIKSIKKLIIFIITIILWPIKYIVPKGNIVILQCHNSLVYADNTKYLYEYLSTHTKYNVYWVTEHEVIIDYITRKGFKFISKKRIFHLIWVSLRAKVVIDSGSMYFNYFGLCDNHITTKICIMHGSGSKASHMRSDNIYKSILPILQHNKFDYVNFTSEYTTAFVAKKLLLLPTKKIICLGYPRCDSFFKKDFTEKRYKDKLLTKELNKNYKKDGKVILYTPTWRPYSYDFPLFLMEGFELEEFNEWLESENIFFFHSAHTVNFPEYFPANLSRFVFIDHPKHPLFDTSLFMHEVDILINDYSTTSTDFALLEKPQIFFMQDYEYYKNEKGFVEDYKAFLPGKEIKEYAQLTKTIKDYLINPQSYVDNYENNIQILLEKYYNPSLTNSSESFMKVITKIIDNPHKIELNDLTNLKPNSVNN